MLTLRDVISIQWCLCAFVQSSNPPPNFSVFQFCIRVSCATGPTPLFLLISSKAYFSLLKNQNYFLIEIFDLTIFIPRSYFFVEPSLICCSTKALLKVQVLWISLEARFLMTFQLFSFHGYINHEITHEYILYYTYWHYLTFESTTMFTFESICKFLC